MANNVRLPFNLQHLQFLIAIGEEGSLTAAAARLGLAQPALSVALARLEAEIGVDLLVREPRGVSLTAAGQNLLRHAYDIVARGELAAQELLALTHAPHGEVVVGLPSSAAAVAAIPFIEQVSETYPNVRLRVVEAFSGYLWDWLERGDIDMAVVFNQADTSSISCTRIAREEMHLMSRRTTRPISTPVAAAELQHYPLAMPSRSNGFSAAAQRHAESHGGHLDIRLEIDAGHQLVKLVQSGRFHSILAPCAVADEIAQKKIMARPIDPPLSRTICVAKAKTQRRPGAANLIAAVLSKQCRSLIAAGIWKASLL